MAAKSDAAAAGTPSPLTLKIQKFFKTVLHTPGLKQALRLMLGNYPVDHDLIGERVVIAETDITIETNAGSALFVAVKG